MKPYMYAMLSHLLATGSASRKYVIKTATASIVNTWNALGGLATFNKDNKFAVLELNELNNDHIVPLRARLCKVLSEEVVSACFSFTASTPSVLTPKGASRSPKMLAKMLNVDYSSNASFIAMQRKLIDALVAAAQREWPFEPLTEGTYNYVLLAQPFLLRSPILLLDSISSASERFGVNKFDVLMNLRTVLDDVAGTSAVKALRSYPVTEYLERLNRIQEFDEQSLADMRIQVADTPPLTVTLSSAWLMSKSALSTAITVSTTAGGDLHQVNAVQLELYPMSDILLPVQVSAYNALVPFEAQPQYTMRLRYDDSDVHDVTTWARPNPQSDFAQLQITMAERKMDNDLSVLSSSDTEEEVEVESASAEISESDIDMMEVANIHAEEQVEIEAVPTHITESQAEPIAEDSTNVDRQ